MGYNSADFVEGNKNINLLDLSKIKIKTTKTPGTVATTYARFYLSPSTTFNDDRGTYHDVIVGNNNCGISLWSMFVCITVGCGYDSEGNICYGATIFFASTNYLLFF